MTIDPASSAAGDAGDGFLGRFQVWVVVSDEIDESGGTFDVSVENDAPRLAHDLDQQLGLYSTGNYYETFRGLGEKYLRGSDGIWYAILPDGALLR